MANTPSVRRWAAALRILTILAMVVLVAALVFGIALAGLPDELRRAAALAPDTALAPLHRAAVAASGAIPSLALLYVLSQMARLFGRYAGGETLSHHCAGHIRRIGAGLLVAVALDLVARPLQVLLASLANPPGERVLSLSLGTADLGQVLAGGLMVVIGWAMGEAALVAEENRGFV
ncbi:DUF2975 domain-containing protein [Vannielia litorea]|uniref:DUF2975 domain-containing protein n=1 Tax=Vannielia litorea TaxID=1217970 RepID=A0A1N6H694_9RHOB|nr:DUF2975 domain-containing protein [Vannielia litorea]SIO15331.1 hypothetical protein SAMN05444002_3117 [Vannielia litorea]